MNFWLCLLGVSGSIAMAGYYSALETAAYGASEVRLRLRQSAGESRAGLALALLNSLPVLITTTLIGHNLAVYIGTSLLTGRLEESHWPDAEFWATLILTPFCFIFAETLPKRLAHSVPNRYMIAGAQAGVFSRAAFRPLSLLLGAFSQGLRGLLARLGLEPGAPDGRRQLIEQIEACAAEGLLSTSQQRMAEKIIALEETVVGTIMISAGQAFCLREDDTCGQAARTLLENEYKQAVIVDRSGRLLPKYVTFNAIMRRPGCLDQPVLAISRDALLIDARTGLLRALAVLKQERQRLAVVTGKAGAPVGVITISRLLGAIVGGLKL